MTQLERSENQDHARKAEFMRHLGLTPGFSQPHPVFPSTLNSPLEIPRIAVGRLRFLFLFRTLRIRLWSEAKCRKRQLSITAGLVITADDIIDDSIINRRRLFILDDFGFSSHLERAFADRY